IRDHGGESTFFQVDVSDGGQVAAMVNFAVETYGKLDIACNNAGIAHGKKRLTDFSEEEWDRVLDINLKGVWLCMKHEIPELLKQPVAAIVNTASISGLVGTAFSAPYTTSKHGVIGLTKTAALDYARTGLRINAICPGVTRTPIIDTSPEIAEEMSRFIPMGRLAEPDEIANAVLWLCSEDASYVNGHSLVADGAYIVS
ncbi:MAG: SDR family oxidoreductase, partial [Porticoccaceae bacterium]|nr:SDR family oxidoreductase [Porticoccaceae bacterium]